VDFGLVGVVGFSVVAGKLLRRQPRICLWRVVFEGNVDSHLVHLNGWQSGKCLKSAWPEGNVTEYFSQVRGCGGLYELGWRGGLAPGLVGEVAVDGEVVVVADWAASKVICCCNCSIVFRSSRISSCSSSRLLIFLFRTSRILLFKLLVYILNCISESRCCRKLLLLFVCTGIQILAFSIWDLGLIPIREYTCCYGWSPKLGDSVSPAGRGKQLTWYDAIHTWLVQMAWQLRCQLRNWRLAV
jgi:hypothetical protein